MGHQSLPQGLLRSFRLFYKYIRFWSNALYESIKMFVTTGRTSKAQNISVFKTMRQISLHI